MHSATLVIISSGMRARQSEPLVIKAFESMWFRWLIYILAYLAALVHVAVSLNWYSSSYGFLLAFVLLVSSYYMLVQAIIPLHCTGCSLSAAHNLARERVLWEKVPQKIIEKNLFECLYLLKTYIRGQFLHECFFCSISIIAFDSISGDGTHTKIHSANLSRRTWTCLFVSISQNYANLMH